MADGSTTEETARYSIDAESETQARAIRMHRHLVEMGGSVSWNSLTGKWHASAYSSEVVGGVRQSHYGSALTPEDAVMEAHTLWVRAGSPVPRVASEEERRHVNEWCDQRDRDRAAGEAVRLAGGQ